MPNRPGIVLPALYGGIIMAVISAVPGLSLLNCFCCAGIMLGGFLSVFFYKKDLTSGMPALSSSDGLKLGALAGVFGAILTVILSKLVTMMLGGADEKMVKDLIESMGLADQLPPGTMEQIEEGMGAGLGVFQIIITFIIDPLFGLIGGLIGYSVFKPKQVVPMTPPPPPVLPPQQQG
jgi:hypothetical protein